MSSLGAFAPSEVIPSRKLSLREGSLDLSGVNVRYDQFKFKGGLRNPYITQLISHTETNPKTREWTLIFDGYWYLEPEVFPTKRELQFRPPVTCLFVEVLERKTLYEHIGDEDSSEDNPVFFPTARIQVTYRVINDLKTREQIETMNTAMFDLDKDESARHEAHRIARELQYIDEAKEEDQEEKESHCRPCSVRTADCFVFSHSSLRTHSWFQAGSDPVRSQIREFSLRTQCANPKGECTRTSESQPAEMRGR